MYKLEYVSNTDDFQVTGDVFSEGLADEIPINYHSFTTN